MNKLLNSRLFYCGIPVCILLFQCLVEYLVPEVAKPAFHSEGGPHELLQAIIIFAAFFLAAFYVFKIQSIYLKLWFLLAAVCCFYVGGEEISWGQHIWGWQTPEDWSALNDQNETNLHNTSDWLDQKPKAVLQLGVLFAGIIIPMLQKYKPALVPQKFAAIYGDARLMPTAMLAVVIKLSEPLSDLLATKIFWRSSEVMELYMFFFVALYLMIVGARETGSQGLKH